MTRHSRPIRRPLFRGYELMRLMTMLVMLAVLAMLIGRAGDPTTWTWLAPAKPQAEPDGAEAKPDAVKEAQEKESIPKPTGPIEDDLEEGMEAFLLNAQTITDGTEHMHKLEMPAYWRLMNWIQNQPLDYLRARPDLKTARLNDLLRAPAKHRGQLFKLDLTIRRIRSHVPEPDNPARLTKLYEIIGTTPESQSWQYMCVTDELPAGLSEAETLDEKGTFYGYFLKVQGYQDAVGKRSVSPVMIGRLEYEFIPSAAAGDGDQSSMFWIGLSLGGLFLLVLIFGWIYGRRRGNEARGITLDAAGREVSIDDWIDRGGLEKIDLGDKGLDDRGDAAR